MALSINLFGGPTLSRTDREFAQLPTRKSEALLAFLVERGGAPVSREALAALLWPYSAEDQARASLRQEISVLRKALGADFSALIVAQGDRIEIAKTGLNVDIWKLRDKSAEGISPAATVELLALYTAPFLDTFRIRSQPFSDWVRAARQALETQVLQLGQNALQQALAEQDHPTIAQISQQLCRIDPTYEPAHRALIAGYLQNGDTTAAQRQLGYCKDALKTHLDIEVSQETLQLFEENHSHVSAPSINRSTLASSKAPVVQQRRFISVLSIELGLQIDDPEDFESASEHMIALIKTKVSARSGFVLQTFGDHFVACFGYPIGYDTDPDTAVFAAREIIEHLSSGPPAAPRVQIGLACGQALITETQSGAATMIKVSGAVVKSAKNIARYAPFAAIVADSEAQSVLSPVIRFQALDHHPSIAVLTGHNQMDDPHRQIVFPVRKHALVGRDAQLDQLLGLLAQAKAGAGSVAVVSGNPGEGKSRLAQEVAEHAVALGFDLLMYQGNRSDRNSTFAPILDQMLQSGAFASPSATAAELEAWLAQRSPELGGAAPYLASLLQIIEPQELDDKDVSEAAKDAALNIFSAQASTAKRPCLMIFEDIQWFDPTSCEALTRLIETLDAVPVLALVLSRKDEAPDVAQHPLAQRIVLDPLPRHNAKVLLKGLLARAQVSSKTIEDVVQRAEGNPLVLEEFAKSIVFNSLQAQAPGLPTTAKTEHATSADWVETPARLLPFLLSRVDAVPGAIQMLQYASVFGRRFTNAQLARMLEPAKAQSALFERLVDDDILFATTRLSETSYIFRHALIGEAIYATIPKRARSKLHAAAAQTLLEEVDQARFSEVARHYRTAGMHAEAAHYFERSGDRAARVSAFAEAISEYREAIAMTERLSLQSKHLRTQLTLNRKIVAQMIALKGMPTVDINEFYTNAQRLSTELGDTGELINASWGHWSIDLMVAKLDRCLETVTSLRPAFERLNSPAPNMVEHYMLGVSHAYRGDLQLARTHLEAALEVYSDDIKDELQMRFGMDLGLTSHSFLGWIYALLGLEAQATRATQHALKMARANDNGLSLVFAHVFSATKCLFLDQLSDAKHHAEQALKGAEEMGFPQWQSQAQLQLARVADLSGDPAALALMQTNLQDYLGSGMVLARPYAQTWIAEAQIRNGAYQDALATLDDLDEHVRLSGERYFESEAQKARAHAQHHLLLAGPSEPRI
ncbi:MAG: AAA family ATPase [Planktotalea arctica]|uniref:AAA family ATPase n=2 Tax=Planktotalea arctica TaxID=1481893 RepID=UPI00321B0291